MATLHVRNVPEPLYELLRERAASQGRSIGAEAVVLIQQRLMPHAAHRALPRRLQGLQRFTERARQAVVRAQDEARSLGAPEVLPGHILLGLLEVEGLARDVLAGLDISPAEIRDRLPQGTGSPRRLPFAAGAKQVLEGALRESLALRHDYIGGEHLLLALADDPLLEGVDVRAAVAAGLGGASLPSVQFLDSDAYLVIDLEGSADEWTECLNKLAAEGWELMQVVERRAILRR